MKIKLSNQRVSSYIERLDPMLGGGFLRGARRVTTCSSGTPSRNPISNVSNSNDQTGNETIALRTQLAKAPAAIHGLDEISAAAIAERHSRPSVCFGALRA